MQLNHPSKSTVIVIGLIFSGCASFEPGLRFQDLARARQPTVREVREGLEVSVEEFATSNKSLMAFDGDIAPYGVLALLVRVENRGTDNYNVQKNETKAILGGQRLLPLSGVEAASQSATSEYVGKALGWTVATGPFFILLWPATIAGSASHTASVNRRIQQHFESLELNDSLLRPNQTAVGFLYFKLPDNTKRLENLTVEMEPIAEQGGKRLSYRLSLPTLDLSGAVATPAASTMEPPK
jgi:hypothetical protein